MPEKVQEQQQEKNWRRRIKRRRGKTFSISMRELNLVAMIDMLTILLVFLLKSYSATALSIPVGGELVVPKSTHMITPEEAVKLTVTGLKDGKGVIAVSDQAVVALDKKRLSKLRRSMRRGGFLIPEVHRALMAEARRIKEIAAVNPKIKFEGKILIIADKTIPYWLVTQVLYTSAEARFDRYQLVAARIAE